ncbi:F0F1 ATP synthase subunit B [Rathayibacter toxicus]|uniref:ATP synthase subunit b n=1 Tax=Rathayibacter toxicus TaxID=145458 RepID=A0A0C5BAI9_9MICO|nr:F0F1 ATP synthase subunit B [Rathayibacter toxicus]AJM77893.1 ATP synthase F0F1 subunit B [Rathayibacter toxicus]ALS57914.1 ATP synthase F0F1 subunit B [Rathayibacter toxicus]KKM46893.1 ATP synthase F0F1 subunit B [Rathayibacter toxicus]PPG20407.1 F0F1 ATP synthase subunit B [Rathayibacter toxicus]PPG45509.1 F0F1 ATP synthase subunit B [Rathayibacter toxicus]
MDTAVNIAAGEGHVPEVILIPEFYDFFWSGVIFLVLLFFFWKLVLPRLQTLLDQRSAAIEGNIAQAQEVQRQAEAALEKYTAQLSQARAEAGAIREKAHADGAAIVAAKREQAQSEAERILHSAHAQIEADRQAAVVSLRSEVGTLAIDLASGVIGESLNDDTRASAIVERFLADLETSEKANS